MPQESFDFDFDTPIEDGDFVISASNSYAYKYIQSWPEWNAHATLLYGPEASGKTFLATIWAKYTGAQFLTPHDIYSKDLPTILSKSNCCIIDDITRVYDEAALLHFFNSAREHRGWLLMTAQKHPSNMGIRLPDLKSRIHAIPAVGLSQPDDMMLRKMFIKQFSDRQLKVGIDVIEFIIARMERSFQALNDVVELLDRQALNERRNITIPLAKKVLDLCKS